MDISACDSIIEDILSRHPSFQSDGPSAYKPGLERAQIFDSLRGHPHSKYPCIHVAGTNGKGSTAHLLASILALSGLKVGLYTSPHIRDFRERARIVSKEGYRMVPKEYVCSYFEDQKIHFDNLGFSFFEITTFLAFDWFATERVDVAIVEVGLGGRIDTTNIITPILSIVASIGLDHEDILGHSHAEIAFEKAGIVKRGVPVVLGLPEDPDALELQKTEVLPVFEKKVRYTNIDDPSFSGNIYDYLFLSHSTARFEALRSRLHPDLGGDYQWLNLKTVFTALSLLPWSVSDDDVVEGVNHCATRTGLEGRWQIIDTKPLTIVDMGHNAAALKYDFAQLSAISDDIVIVYAKARDKDFEAILPLFPLGARVVFTQASNNARACPAKELQASFLAMYPSAETFVEVSPAKALDLARSLCRGNTVVYVGGTSFILKEIL